jgi:hypothetical protein
MRKTTLARWRFRARMALSVAMRKSADSSGGRNAQVMGAARGCRGGVSLRLIFVKSHSWSRMAPALARPSFSVPRTCRRSVSAAALAGAPFPPRVAPLA